MKHKFVSAIKNFIQSWLYPLLALIVGFMIYAFGLNQQVKWIFVHFDLVLEFLCILVLISSVIQFKNGKWFRGIAQLGIMAFTVLSAGFLAMFYPYDYYADDLKLPNNISLEKPEVLNIAWEDENGKLLDSTLNTRFKLNEFKIFKDTQPGTYKYFVRVRLKQSGTLCIKAFEPTHNHPLSPKSLKERTSSNVVAGEIALHHKEFTIFEGDWGRPYAARFELWFKPEGVGEDQQLLEKTYLIEGWSR